MLHVCNILAMVFAAAAAAGCSSVPELIVGSLPVASTPQSEDSRSALYDPEPTELYVRIARGANACWFGRDGPLKATHIFHADVAPPHSGGGAEIVIFERDPTAPTTNPRSLRALRITITRSDARSRVDVQRHKLSAELAAQLMNDAHRWAGGDPACAESTSAAGTPAAATAGGAATPATPPARAAPEHAKTPAHR